MPRKTKETNEEIIESKSKTAKKATKSTAKKTAAKKETKTTTKKAAAKKGTKATTKKAAAKKETEATTKKVAAKKETKTTTKKAVKDEAKKTTTKAKTATKKTTTKATSKSATKAKSTTKATKTTAKAKTTRTRKAKAVAPSVVEYYDLPYKYNQTVVKVLYQNPTTLFVYWEISDDDIENYKSTYGDNFFETTKPVLLIYNETMNYKFEIDINDFANC